jgi:pimeloyl-ACP methyl ester carboxylesterase
MGGMQWVCRILAALGLLLVVWALVTAGPAVVHGHPAFAFLLALTVAGCVWALIRHRRERPAPSRWRRVGSLALAIGAVAWLVGLWWLRPFSAQEPALTAMASDPAVTVSESTTRIVMTPTGVASDVAVFFQPGAKVEARAYAAVLRPLAEAGHRVVIVKQPLGIAFLAVGAFDRVQAEFPEVAGWVVGGHSLGGTVASIEADDSDQDVQSPARGLLLYASYPGSDISESLDAPVLSISGTNDGLATPADIEKSRVNLPPGTQFQVIDGAIHSFFGDYGLQPGDGEPGISHDDARAGISRGSISFLADVAGTAEG